MLSAFRTNNLLLALMFFEIFLMPLWNIGPIPFKFSFIVILFSLINKSFKFSFIYPLIGLIFILWTGKFFSYVFLNEYEFQQTIRITINYLLIISALLYSKKIKNIDNLNWIALLALSFTFINIFLLILGPTNPSIISFYKLDLRLEEGLFMVRNPGIAGNPNGSALMGNLILLFWVVSKKFNLITLKSSLWNTLVFISIGLAIISFVSKSGFFAYFIICLWYFKNNFSLRKLSYAFISLIIPMVFLINYYNKLDTSQKIVIENGIEQVLNFDEELIYEIGKDAGTAGNRIYKQKLAYENFIISPLFGIGSDRSTGKILNRTQYHNDFSEILVSTGILGILIYIFLIYKISKVSFILLLPFLFPGMTNSFFFTLQIVAFYFLFVGIMQNIKINFSEKITDSSILQKFNKS